MTLQTPLVSCLMIAGANPEHASRAVFCYQQQNWERKELIVIDYGATDIAPLFEDIPSDEVRYIRASLDTGKQTMATLKNMGLDHANGEFVINWDECDWSHPERIRIQADALTGEFDICWLGGTLLHLDHPEFVHHPYLDIPRNGYAGSLMHRNRQDKRYAESKKDVDRLFISNWDEDRCSQIGIDYSWLMVRSLAGETGTKSYKRFLSGFRNNIKDMARYTWLKIRGRSMVSHKRFKLTPEGRESIQKYLHESRRLGLITSVS